MNQPVTSIRYFNRTKVFYSPWDSDDRDEIIRVGVI